ncbi:glycosyltransferase [Leeuwenhoekiella palythoae]|uniref:Glycosyltransferase involved in cell wall biosynthesis n=1 Tax=Leeuwenhoekiella palythoae TaxID=573501 RepID=A0A1M5UDE2_9FLAO|nr:glycosyltransferase [Leeuwenhoekiella palythoae]RXG27158.1 glycosyltransferase involved in cell wall biosynthesis [Leeuwenhoekiella palythoae]SHH60836.1 Glycosyltransferase involved in cell wall bisynthesis [Leeuwenhoekiella palythoae]
MLFLQPSIPHYRTDFFRGVAKFYTIKVFVSSDTNRIKESKFELSTFKAVKITSLKIGPFLLYNPLPFIISKEGVVLMLNFCHLTTWFVLLCRRIVNRDTILWGHGISVKRYMDESSKPSSLIKWQIKLSNLVWLYTEKEKKIWCNEGISPKKIVALDNTLSDVERILAFKPTKNKAALKIENKIKYDRVCIFSARFTLKERRADLLKKIIEATPDVGFVIIGEGPYKPDFSVFDNVYDFGALYDNAKKEELFSLADIYLQPAWLGLSIVEAMAYGLPIFTLARSKEIKQCVEYYYLEESKAGVICEDVDALVTAINSCEQSRLLEMGNSARVYIADNLLMNNMVNNAVESIKSLEY